MTIAVAVKTNDGVVLASDSASSILTQEAQGVLQVYNNADKIFNLHKGLPIGIVTYGLGGIGPVSISTLAKDFRANLTQRASDPEDEFDPEDYELEEVLEAFKLFIFDEHYVPTFEELEHKPAMGFMMAGYSSESSLAELWGLDIDDGKCRGPYRLLEDLESGILANGQHDPITRLVGGFEEYKLRWILGEAGLDGETANDVIELASQHLQENLIHPAMPIQDTIDIAKMLVELAIDYYRFKFEPPTVGGPVDVAAISKHEGFKWVRRKHYYRVELNPPWSET